MEIKNIKRNNSIIGNSRLNLTVLSYNPGVFICLGFFHQTREFITDLDVTMTGEGLQILTYA